MSDIAVVGGGIGGASLAFALALRGANVTVIDDARIGSATPAGAGMIAPWATTLDGDVYELYAAGADAYPRLLAELAAVGIDDAGYETNGALMVSDDAAVMPEVIDRVTRRASVSGVAGSPELVDAKASRQMFPPLAEGWSGLYVPGGARVDGRKLAAALLDGVQRLGGEVRQGTAMIRGDAITVDGAVVRADTTVVTTGAWINELLGDERSVGVQPQRGQLCHLHLGGVDTTGWPSVLPMRDHYLIPFRDGRVVVGATREPGVGFDPRLTADGVAAVLHDALEVAPGLKDATVLEWRVGLRPYPSADSHPIIGPIDEHTWIATGFGAIGLTLCPTVGFRLAAMIDGETDDALASFARRNRAARDV